jgi:hypothetical protein
MAIPFVLCSKCLEKYRRLRFDPACHYSLNILPFCSLEWPDEHPARWVRECCDECRLSITRLVRARTNLWRQGDVPEEARLLWSQAQEVVPHWPGFQRLSLNIQQLRSLDACNEELSAVMEAIIEHHPRIAFTDKGGGVVEFTAEREQGE